MDSHKIINGLLKTHYESAEARRRFLIHQLRQPTEFRIIEAEDGDINDELRDLTLLCDALKNNIEPDSDNEKMPKPEWSK